MTIKVVILDRFDVDAFREVSISLTLVCLFGVAMTDRDRVKSILWVLLF